MTKTIVALYDDFSTAERVIDNLLEAGFARDDISIMANDASNTRYRDEDMVTDGDVSAGEGAGFGAVIGTLIGVGVALIPGIGPVLGAGPLAVALTAGIGAAAGAITGGITAGLIDMGVDEIDAHAYAEGVRRGGTLISLTTNDEWAERAEQIMNRYHPVDIDTRSSLWREGGWSNFDHNAQPYSADQIEKERLAYRDYDVNRGMGSTSGADLIPDRDRVASIPPTGGGMPMAGNSETMQRASIQSDMQRGMSTNPGGMGASGTSGMGSSGSGSTAGISSGTPSGHEVDTAPAVSDYDNTSGGHWAANRATQAQNEHAKKMSGVIPHSQTGATPSGDVAAGATPPGAERHHETSRAVDTAMDRDTSGDSSFDETDTQEIRRHARSYPRSQNEPDSNPTDINHLNR